jgi:putative hemolysin
VRGLVQAMYERGGDISQVDLASLVRPALMVPETKDVDDLLHEFRRASQHLAIVINEYGTMEGIVTLEDLIEEIVGEIEDEFDVPEADFERIDDDTWRIDGTLTIDEFNERFKCALPDGDYHTVAGFVFGELGRAPEPGDEVEYDGMTFRVESMEGQRIDRLTVTFGWRHGQPEQVPAENEL